MIKLYGFESCGPYKQVKRLLDKFGIKYEYIDVLKKKGDFGAVFPILELEDGTQIIGLGKTMTNYIRRLAESTGRNYERQGKILSKMWKQNEIQGQ